MKKTSFYTLVQDYASNRVLRKLRVGFLVENGLGAYKVQYTKTALWFLCDLKTGLALSSCGFPTIKLALENFHSEVWGQDKALEQLKTTERYQEYIKRFNEAPAEEK